MKYTFSLFITILFLLSSCNKISNLPDAEIISGDAEFAIPLISASFNLQELLENFEEATQITVEPDGCIRLTYEGDVLGGTADDIVERVNAAIPPAVPITEPNMILPFAVPGEFEMDFIRLKAGLMGYTFTISNGDTLDVTLTLPNFKKNGEVLQFNRLAEGNGEYFIFPLFDIADYEITPEADGTLLLNYTATKPNGEQGVPEQFLLGITNLEYDYLEGYMGNELFDSSPGTIEVDFFDEFIRGDIWFQDPTITMTINSSFGIPVSSKSNYFRVITVNGDTLHLRSDEIGDELRVDFNYPSLDEIGETRETVFVFNKENSNIDSILGSGPVRIEYDVDAQPNPDADPTIRGFIACESLYTVTLKADLPIYGRSKGFGTRDTFDFDFDGYEGVKSAEFKVVTENEMPLDIAAQIYFATADGIITDSLFNEVTTLIGSASVNAEGFAIDPGKEVFLIPIDERRFDVISNNSKKIIVQASFSTTDNGEVPVKVLADQNIDLRMGLKLVRE